LAFGGFAVQTARMVDELGVPVSHERRRELNRRVAEVSRRFDAWAALGDALPAGEWDCVVAPVVGLLATGASAAEIASRIGAEMREHYGLARVIGVPDVAFAAELRRWWDGQDRRAR